jgi:hypothetical protein
MTDTPDHFCPCCGTAQKSFPRYAWHFCNDCCKQATDRSGRQVECTNVSMSGGFQWRYVGTDDWTTCRGLYCYILRRDVYLTDARFGGIVAQPLLSMHRATDTEGLFKSIDIRKD